MNRFTCTASHYVCGSLRSAGRAPERLFERVVAEHRGAWASAIAQSRDRSAIEAVEMALTEGLGRAFDSGGAVVPVGRVRPDAAVDTVLARLKMTSPAEHCDLAWRYAADLLRAGIVATREALAEADASVGDELLAAARTALETGHAGAALARVSQVRALRHGREGSLWREAELHEIEAECHLVLEQFERSAAAFEARAQVFAGLDAQEEAKLRNAGAYRLCEQAGPSGETALREAIALLHRNEAIWTRDQHPTEWVQGQINLGHTKARLAARVAGSAGVDLLGQAAAAYRAALTVRNRESEPLPWAITQSNLGRTVQAQAARSDGPTSVELLREASAAYRSALEIWTRDANSFDWAITQDDLGGALLGLAWKLSGDEEIQLLEAAETASRAALEVYSLGERPEDWARVQKRLTTALGQRAARTAGAEGVALLEAAIEELRAILGAISGEGLEQFWAHSQNNLGAALEELAQRKEGPERPAIIQAAVVAYRAALSETIREAEPVNWAIRHENLGGALLDQSWTAGGEEAVRLREEAIRCLGAAIEGFACADRLPRWARAQNHLAGVFAGSGRWAEAMTAYHAALGVWTREAHPSGWATAQNNIGNLLVVQAGETDGREGVRMLEAAVAAYRGAVEVWTAEAYPTEHAGAQARLARALQLQAARVMSQNNRVPAFHFPAAPEQGAELMNEAVAAYRAALQGRAREIDPLGWASAQSGLGLSLVQQAVWTEGAAGAELLESAITGYRLALEVWTREAHPSSWADLHSNIGAALHYLALRSEDAAIELLEQAVRSYRAALEVFTPETHPESWALAQSNTGEACYELAVRSAGAAAAELLQEAVRSYRLALDEVIVHPMNRATTEEHLGLALEAMADRGVGDAPKAYRRAVEMFEAALAYFLSTGMKPREAECAGWRARVADKLAGLG